MSHLYVGSCLQCIFIQCNRYLRSIDIVYLGIVLKNSFFFPSRNLIRAHSSFPVTAATK